MLGTFQKSNLRIEVSASELMLRKSLTDFSSLRQWLCLQRLPENLPDELHAGLTFTSWLGPIAIQHTVAEVSPNCVRLILSQGVDGFHEWHWGDGWVQSRIEGISLLPINLGQTLSLLQLRQFLVAAPHS